MDLAYRQNAESRYPRTVMIHTRTGL